MNGNQYDNCQGNALAQQYYAQSMAQMQWRPVTAADHVASMKARAVELQKKLDERAGIEAELALLNRLIAAAENP